MTNQHDMYIGIGGSNNQVPWINLAERLPTLHIIDDTGQRGMTFGRKFGLDVEIMASSLVVARLDLPSPGKEAGLYHIPQNPEYAPAVVVPPVLAFDDWPDELRKPTDSSPIGFKAFILEQSSELLRYDWKMIFKKIAEIKRESASDLRIGFHIDTLGFFSSSPTEIAQDFGIAYLEYCSL